jgi:predicted transcriptional regulator
MKNILDRNWQARIDALKISRARIAREAGLCEMTVHKIFTGQQKKPLSRTVEKIEAAIKGFEKKQKRIAN